MGFFRFRRSFQVFPGLRYNLSKTGGSVSIGHPGATINLRGDRIRATMGIPGSGLSYSETTRLRDRTAVLPAIAPYALATALPVSTAAVADAPDAGTAGPDEPVEAAPPGQAGRTFLLAALLTLVAAVAYWVLA